MAGCGTNSIPSEGTDASASPSATANATRQCTDAKGATSKCAVEPNAQECALGDAKACMVQTLEAVTVGDKGPCLRVVYENRCGRIVYTDTRIEHVPAGKDPRWQGWTSTTFAGATLDLDQCGATGRYTNIATFSDGRLDTLATQCPLPQ